MRRMLAHLAILVTIASTLVALPAAAQVDVELAFTPSTVAPGDQVTLFASIANLGDAAVRVDLSVAVEVNGKSFGPVTAPVTLPAGFERSREVTLVIPPVFPAATITITVTAAGDGFSDTATATLTVTNATTAAPGNDPSLATWGRDVLTALGGYGPTAVNEASISQVKQLYR